MSVICFTLDQSKILPSGNELMHAIYYICIVRKVNHEVIQEEACETGVEPMTVAIQGVAYKHGKSCRIKP